MSLRCAFFIALAGVTGLTVSVRSQQTPPPEAGNRLVEARLVGNEVEMRDAANNAPLIIPKGVPLWQDKNEAGSLQPTIDFQAQPDGFDVVYTFVNEGKSRRTLGCFNLGILTLGHAITYPDLRQACGPVEADYNEGYKVRQAQYPDSLYSPAWVLENKDYAVGVSIQYPILDYKHDVRLSLYAPEGRYAQGEGGRGWKLEFLLSNLGNETEENRLACPGLIGPGETRVYTVSVRITRNVSEWVRTLTPYRDWFQSHYGGVSYTRQGGCINGRPFSAAEWCSDANPLGFGDARPDINGWGTVVAGLSTRHEWDTLMFLAPSGSYRANSANNLPYQFATNWGATQPLSTATDTDIGFPRLVAAGQKIGFWWGHSLQVADQWDDDSLVPFDPTNPDQRQRAFAEMDMAVKAGASTIVLGGLSPRITPIWELLDWLRGLKDRYPGIRFCAEPLSCDLIHRETATIFRGDRDRTEAAKPDQVDGFRNPHYLADFLLPGHETWGSFRWDTYQDAFGMSFTDQQKTDTLRRIASLGFTPFAMGGFHLLDVSIEAAKSWEATVPPDLQPAPPRDDGQVAQDEDDAFPTLQQFDAAFKAGQATADLNNDGVLNLFDYTAWQRLHPSTDSGVDHPAPADSGARSGKGAKVAARPTAKPASRSGSKRPTSGRNGRKSSSPPRLEIKVTHAAPGNDPAHEPPPAPRSGFHIHAPQPFSDEEIAAALARARGLDDTAYRDGQTDAQADEPPDGTEEEDNK